VTIAFQGEVEHHDSTGNSGKLSPGDVQWMTAGRGIIHQEYHSKDFTKNGGTFEMCQLWVNLPKKHKMTKPRYQAITKEQIAEVKLPLGVTDEADQLGTARIIAGELDGTKGPAKTFSPVQMWDVILPRAGVEVEVPFPADQNCILFVRRGGIDVLSGVDGKSSANSVGPQDVAMMKMDGSDVVRMRVTKPDSSVIVMGGEMLNEPIAAQGPFVMNTPDEIHQAISDYQSGKMGR